MTKTLPEWKEQAQLAQELGDIDAELEAREAIERISVELEASERSRIERHGITPEQALQIQSGEIGAEDIGIKGASFAEGLQSAGEAGAAISSQMIGTPIAGLMGGVASIGRIPEGEAYKGGEDVQAIREMLIYTPESEEGKRVLQQFSESITNLPVMYELTNIMKWLEKTGKEGGKAAEELGAPPSISALIETTPQILPELLAMAKTPKAVKGVMDASGEAIKNVVGDTAQAVKGFELPQTKGKQEIAQKLAEGQIDKTVAGYKLKEPRTVEVDAAEIERVAGQAPEVKQIEMQATPGEQALSVADEIPETIAAPKAPRAVKDPLQQAALRQGFEDKHLADIANSTPETKSKMLKMVEARKKAQLSGREDILGRSSDVMGESILERVKFLDAEKKKAGKAIDDAANELKTVNVDAKEAFTDFRDNLQRLDVTIGKDGKLDFRGSAVDDVKSARIINEVFERARRAFEPRIVDGVPRGNAFELHKLKRYIDNKVSYKKHGKEGLDAEGERVVKELRAKIDEALDNLSPDYDKANISYRDTKTAIDDIEDILGSKISTSDKGAARALGIKTRGIESNAPYGTRLLNAMDNLDKTSAKYGRVFKDDIVTMQQLNSQLDNVLGVQSRTGLEGSMERAVGRGVEAQYSPVTAALRGAGQAIDKAKGKTPDRALQSIEELLKGGK